jgi:hypothetical protein
VDYGRFADWTILSNVGWNVVNWSGLMNAKKKTRLSGVKIHARHSTLGFLPDPDSKSAMATTA